jgi:hypothetical protein
MLSRDHMMASDRGVLPLLQRSGEAETTMKKRAKAEGRHLVFELKSALEATSSLQISRLQQACNGVRWLKKPRITTLTTEP